MQLVNKAYCRLITASLKVPGSQTLLIYIKELRSLHCLNEELKNVSRHNQNE